MMKTIGLILITILAAQAWAGSKIIGNGGVVFLCDEGKTARLLDFWEHTDLRHMGLIDPPGVTYQEKLEFVRKRLGRKFPRLAELLKQEIYVFSMNPRAIDGLYLEDSEDALNKAGPANCRRAQAANNSDPELVMWGEPLFLINGDIWRVMSELDKAGLVLHEVLFHIGSRYGTDYSKGVRLLVGLAFSAEFDNLPDVAWMSGFRETRLPFYEMGGIRIPLFEGGLRECGHIPGSKECIREGAPFQPSTVNFDGRNTFTGISYPNDGEDIEWKLPESRIVMRLKTKRADFEYLNMYGDSVAIHAEGLATFVLSDDRDSMRPLYFQMQGVFEPSTGFFKGTVQRMLSRTEASGSAYDFDGRMIDMLTALPQLPSLVPPTER